MEVLVFATFCCSNIDLGSRRNVVVGDGDFFLSGGEGTGARERVGVGLIGNADVFVFLGGGDDETGIGGGLESGRFRFDL